MNQESYRRVLQFYEYGEYRNYRGRYVAINGNRIIANKNLDELLKKNHKTLRVFISA